MNILALQGGGCLGRGQVVVLGALETIYGPVPQKFDLIAGTSVGCILGAMVAAGLPAAKLAEFFNEYAPVIFKTDPWQLAISRLWNSAKYKPDELEAALKALLGDLTLADCKTKFIATAVDMKTGRNVYFQSYGATYMDDTEVVIAPDYGMKLWQVCRASSAAQSYFPGYRWNGMTLWDGGSTGCNAPDMLALTEAKTFVPIDEIKMLSLGSGRTFWKYSTVDTYDPGIKTVLEATLDIAYACGETNEVWQAKEFLGDRHLRLNANLGAAYSIDDASPATLAAIAAAWEKEVANNPVIMNAWR